MDADKRLAPGLDKVVYSASFIIDRGENRMPHVIAMTGGRTEEEIKRVLRKLQKTLIERIVRKAEK